MEIYIFWFLLALVLLGLEMATGTFYLLVLSIAAVVGGGAALLGLGATVQSVLAAMTSVAGIILLRRWRGARTGDSSTQSLDTGHPVKVVSWRDNGMARVFYRGAEWDAELEAASTDREATLYIKSMRGSVLILSNKNIV